MVKTVGDLKRLLENVPDDYKLEALDEFANEVPVIEIEMVAGDENDRVCFLHLEVPDPDDDDVSK